MRRAGPLGSSDPAEADGAEARPAGLVVTTVQAELTAACSALGGRSRPGVPVPDASPLDIEHMFGIVDPSGRSGGRSWPSRRRAGRLFPDETAAERHVGTGEYAGMEFLHVNARTIINAVPASSRMPFRYTINAYRGCSHACTYCFARPTHEYLGLGIGEDFERRIVVKVNAVERLRAELRVASWRGDHIAMGTNTDPYQHAEGKYHLTRGIVEVLAEARNPFSILTKSTLVLRDLDLLAAAAERTEVRVNLSIGTLDREVWRLTEPGTPPPDQPRGGGAAAQRGGDPVRRAGRPGPARALRRRDQLPRSWRRVPRPGPVGSAARRCICAAPSGSTTSPGSPSHDPIWCASTGLGSDGVPTNPRPSECGSNGSCVTRQGPAASPTRRGAGPR